MINKRTLAWGVSLMFVLVTAVSFHLYGMQKRLYGKKTEAEVAKMKIMEIETLIALGRTDEAKRRIAQLPAGQVKTDLEALVSGKPKKEKEPKNWKEVKKQAKDIAKQALNTADSKKYEAGDALYDNAIKARNDAKAANDLVTAKAAKKGAQAALEAAKSAPNKPLKDLGDSEAVKQAKAAVSAFEGKILGAGKLVNFITQTLPGNANFKADKGNVQSNAAYTRLKALVDEYQNKVEKKAINDANAAEIEASAKDISNEFDIIDYAGKKATIEALIKDDIGGFSQKEIEDLKNMDALNVKNLTTDAKTEIFNKLKDMENNLDANDPNYDDKADEINDLINKFNPNKL